MAAATAASTSAASDAGTLAITDARLAQFIKGFDAEIAARPAAEKAHKDAAAAYEAASKAHGASMAKYERDQAAYRLALRGVDGLPFKWTLNSWQPTPNGVHAAIQLPDALPDGCTGPLLDAAVIVGALSEVERFGPEIGKRHKQSAVIVRPLTADEADEDAGPMFRVRFDDGYEGDAFADELETIR